MKRASIHPRVDLTFWLAILILLATMLSRHVGRLMPVHLNFASGGSVGIERGEVINPEN